MRRRPLSVSDVFEGLTDVRQGTSSSGVCCRRASGGAQAGGPAS